MILKQYDTATPDGATHDSMKWNDASTKMSEWVGEGCVSCELV